MDNYKGEVKRIKAIFATTHRVESYGGVQLTRDQIKDLASTLLQNKTDFPFNHDPTNPLRSRVLATGTSELEDGELAGWVEYEMPVEDWEYMQSHFKEAGVLGGYSITLVEKFYRHGSGIEVISVSADAANWTNDELLECINYAPITGAVQVNILYQFSIESIARVVLEVLSTVSLGVVSNLLTDLLRKSKTKPLYGELVVKRSKRKVKIVFKTSSQEGIAKLVAQLPDIMSSGGIHFNLGELDSDEKK